MQRSRTRRLLVMAMLAAVLTTRGPASSSAQVPTPQVALVPLTSVEDWQRGCIMPAESLLITNNEGGELRLAGTGLSGTFLSAPITTTFGFNAASATWHAEIPAGTTLTVEVRQRADAPNLANSCADEGWGPWQPLAAGDARSQADDGAFAAPAVVVFPANSRYLQLRTLFKSNAARASAILTNLTLAYINSLQGPTASPGLPLAPITAGAETLTTRPTMVTRSVWSAGTTHARPERAQPRGIVIHQVDTLAGASDTLAQLRALATYQTQVLGWDDLAYHYLIDDNGMLYEGRLGGPTSAVARLAGGDTAVHVALLDSALSTPSKAMQATLVRLLAWLGQAYQMTPTGQHTVVVGDTHTPRPNIAGHNEVASEAGDPGQPMRDLLPQIRSRADQATVRSRWYFAEGNISDYSERLIMFNPTATDATATMTFFPSDIPTIERTLTVPANSRVDVALNDLVTAGVLPTTSALPVIVESNGAIIVERSLNLTTDIDGGPGIDHLSRVWYFAEGSTRDTFNTYLALFNPQATATNATVSYIQAGGIITSTEVTIGPRQRTVLTVRDHLPNADFSMRVIANQPIAAERTMRFGMNQTGLHTGRGMIELSRRWLFAEGTTEPPFTMRLLILNPNNQPADATVTFLTASGEKIERRYALPPLTRLAVEANDIVVPPAGVGTIVEADRPVAVERVLYFRDNAAGTVSPGVTSAAYTWLFADGRTNDSTAYLLLSNPNTHGVSVTIDFTFLDGAHNPQRIDMPANSRYTLAVHQLFPNENGFSAIVRATYPIIAERSIYPGGGERGGATAPGIAQ